MTALGALAVLAVPGAGAAQTPLERTPLLHGGWVAQPWTLHVDPAFRFDRRVDRTVRQRGTFAFELALPRGLLAGARFAPQSPLVERRPTEWEAYLRLATPRRPRYSPLDLAIQVGYNDAARSADAEVSAARWFGPVRLIGAGRLFSDAWREDRLRLILAAGGVLFPVPRRVPIALIADVASPFDRGTAEDFAWSAGFNLGVPYTTHTLALYATNTATGTLQGASRGTPRTRIAIAVTAPIPAGQILGRVAPRGAAMQAVQEDVPAAPQEFAATIIRHAFAETRVVVPRGSVVAWTNRDAVVHTVTADHGAWDSGAIQPGESWRARFDQPGIYAFHCGPHPYMKGVVVVR